MVALERKGHTRVTREAGTTTIRYYNTDIVKFDGRRIVLNTGGWQSASTKDRMNQASRQFGLGFSVRQKNFVWSVDYMGKVYLFNINNEIILERRVI